MVMRNDGLGFALFCSDFSLFSGPHLVVLEEPYKMEQVAGVCKASILPPYVISLVSGIKLFVVTFKFRAKIIRAFK